MKLTGLDLRIIPGVEMVFLDAPLQMRARALTLGEEHTLEMVAQRIREAREAAYQRAGTETAGRAEIVRNRLGIELEWKFSSHEIDLLAEALDACISELQRDPGADINIHFNGDEYGVGVEALIGLKGRLMAER